MAPRLGIARDVKPRFAAHLGGPRPALFDAVLDELRLAPAPVIVVIEDAQGVTCIASAQPGRGALGVHCGNGSLLDSTVDALRPEALIYEPLADGKLRLVGVEYLVFEAA